MDFRDTAAVLANCDLLISSDSAVVHLAGAMGIPTWLALRWIPEWRWGLDGRANSLVRQRSSLPATTQWRLGRRDSGHDYCLDAKKSTVSKKSAIDLLIGVNHEEFSIAGNTEK